MAFFDIEPFVDKNSERFMLSKRVGAIKEELRARYLIVDREPVVGFQIRDGQYPASAMKEGEWRDYDGDNELWGGREVYCWFRQVAHVPERFKGKDVYYAVWASDNGSWTSSTRPQFILFVDGKAVSGMDENHSEIRVLKDAIGGEKLKIHLNAYSDDHDYRGRMFLHAELRVIDKDVKRLYYHLHNLLEAANLYGPDDEPRIRLVKGLTEACNILDLSKPADAEFKRSVLAANEYIETKLLGADAEDATVWAIGHSHIDVAWLWRLRQTRDKAARTFASMSNLMDEYPDFRFISSQAQLYEFVKQDYPEIYETVKRRVREGRWEIEGGMWVEADTNITSGESLIRQFLVGKRFFRDEFDKNCEILWLPDVFGYSGALPQILKGCGIKYFMTTKISWNEYTKVPYDTFIWEGIDGTQILSHFSPAQSYNAEKRGWFMTTYNSDLSPNQVMGSWQRYSNKDLNNDVLVCYGHGDGGGGTAERMIEAGLRMRAGIPGVPKVKFEFAGEFFKKLEKDVSGSRRLNKWRGELYLEYHRGTLTAQAINKRFNRKSELLYQDVESVSSLASVLLDRDFAKYPKTVIDAGWKTILLNQFHDIIPGSSIAPVYKDSKEQYEKIIKDGRYLLADAAERIAAAVNIDGESVTVFNTIGFACERAVETGARIPEGLCICGDDGAPLPQQKTHDGRTVFLAKGLPAKGYRAFRLLPGDPGKEGTAIVNGNHIETRFYDVTFSDQMEISSFYCKMLRREAVPKGKVWNRIIAFEERPYQDKNWNTNAYFEEKSEIVDNVQSARLLENGPVRAVFEITRKFKNSHVKQLLIFYNHDERVDVRSEIDWNERSTIVKAEFPLDVNAEKATYDIQFGNIERPTHSNTVADFAKFEASAHKWADMSDNGFGVSILNDCKYGYNIKDGRIRLSLLRSQNQPQDGQDLGYTHFFTYAIYPHAGPVASSDVVLQGYDLNVPAECVVGKGGGKLPAALSLISCNRDNIVIETVKKAEDSDALIVRAYETWNMRARDCIFSTDLQFEEVGECDMMEENETPVKIGADKKSFASSFRPFEIKTFRIKVK
ncbi:MAG: alpha-mannosidase [Clostridia bacterium]|nr:alpha-mannosidase [Clostridia bacterium]